MMKRLLRNVSGASTVEYGLISSLISVACIAAAERVGVNLTEVFNTIADAMASTQV